MWTYDNHLLYSSPGMSEKEARELYMSCLEDFAAKFLMLPASKSGSSVTVTLGEDWE